MSVRWRLRSVIESRRVEGVCWRCAIRNPRNISTAHSRIGAVDEAQQLDDICSPFVARPQKSRPEEDISDTDTVPYNAARAEVLVDKLGDTGDSLELYKKPESKTKRTNGARDRSNQAKTKSGQEEQVPVITKSPLIKKTIGSPSRAKQVQRNGYENLTEGRGIGTRNSQRFDKPEPALHRQEISEHTRASTEEKWVIRKHLARPDNIASLKSSGQNSQLSRLSSRPMVERMAMAGPCRSRKPSGPGSRHILKAASEHRPGFWQRNYLDVKQSPDDAEENTSRPTTRTRFFRSYPSGRVIRRLTQTVESQSDASNDDAELDLLIEQLSQNPKTHSTGVLTKSQSSPQAPSSAFPGQRQPRPKLSLGNKAAAEPFGMTRAYSCHPRLASTMATRITNLDHNHPTSTTLFTDVGMNSAHKTIREHLRGWKATQSKSTRPSWASRDDTQPWAGGALNAITQSGGDDEDLTALNLSEDLEPERDMSATSEDVVGEMMNPDPHIRRGELVEFNVGRGSIIGVLVRTHYSRAQIYTERGTWAQVAFRDISFTVPHIFHPNDLSDLLPYLPSQEDSLQTSSEDPPVSHVPRILGFPVIERLTSFLRASDAVYRKHADRLTRAYEILSEGHFKGQSSIRLVDAALRVLQKSSISELTPPMLLVIHRTLDSNPYIDRHTYFHRATSTFTILPRATQARVNSVSDWIREYQNNLVMETREPTYGVNKDSNKESINPVASFAARARRIITSNRQYRPLSPTGALGPCLTESTSSKPCSTTSEAAAENQEPFSDDEQEILKFIEVWAASPKIKSGQTASSHSLGPMILRAVGMYPEVDLGRTTGFTLLQELGIIKPWELFSMLCNKLELPNRDPDHPATILRDQAYDSVSCMPLSRKDSMAEFRNDWDNLTVFCIDGEDTIVRDDGISLEAVNGDSSSCWVHVHVANPSAFLEKDSAVARYAHHATANVYLPDHVYPMMDARLSQNEFSLAKGRPCITFSAKIAADGDVIETRISHGLLNDVRHLTLDQVKKALVSDDSIGAVNGENVASVLQVGRHPWSRGAPKALKESPSGGGLREGDIDSLRRLQEVSMALTRQRQRRGTIESNVFNPAGATGHIDTRVHIGTAENQSAAVRTDLPRSFMHDATISIDRIYQTVGPINDMVAEFMILAGDVCATWCVERNIPIPYRGIISNPDADVSPAVYRKTVLDPLIASRGFADDQTWREYLYLVGVFSVSSSPLEHVGLGLSAYCHATSPLRRFGDLITHWQVEAAIRHEHATGKSLVGRALADPAATSFLPFTQTEVESEARRLSAQEGRIKRATREVISHWTTHAIHRAFYFNEAPLPPTLEFVVKSAPNSTHRGAWGFLSAFRKSAVMDTAEASVAEGGYHVNDRWEAKIVRVLPNFGVIIMHPIRLIQRGDLGITVKNLKTLA